MEIKSTCKETDAEPVKVSKENVLKLSCHIDNGAKGVDHMSEGLKISMEGDVEKYSDALGRNAIFTQKSSVNRLPSYLTVQFVRFYWKKESVSAGTKAGKAKILKNVSFPKVFDIYDFCSEDLRKQLDLGRDYERKQREAVDNKKLEGKEMASEDVEMKDEEEKKEVEAPKNVKARLAEEKEKEIKISDEQLYRPHG